MAVTNTAGTTTTIHINPADNRSSEILVTGVFFVFLTIFVTALRLYGRLHLMKHRLALDDVFIVVAAVFGANFLCTALISVHYGTGTHYYLLSDHEKSMYQLMIWICASMYIIGMGAVKFSMLALYWRLSPSQGFRKTLVFMFVFVGLLAISNTAMIIFQCIPIQKTWDLSVKHGSCINIYAFYFANSALNILTDFAVYLLPIRMLWKIQLPIRQKISLCGIFCLGSLACIASICRVVNIRIMTTSGDHSWNITDALIWSFIEMGVSVLAASLPSLKVVIRTYFPCILGPVSQNRSGDADPHPQSSSYGKSLELRSPRRYPNPNSLGVDTTIMTVHNNQSTPSVHDFHDTPGNAYNSSKEQIVPEGMIMKTTTFMVDIGDDGLEAQSACTADPVEMRPRT